VSSDPVSGDRGNGERLGGGQLSGGRPGLARRRQYLLTLLLGAAGAGLVLLSVRQDWAHVLTRAPAPLPSPAVAVSGQALVPLAGALGLAALAGMVAVIATRGAARRVVGGLLAVFGLGIAVAVSLHLGSADVLAAAHSAGVSPAGSVTGGSGSGSASFPGGAAPSVTTAGRVVLAALPWRVAAVLGSAAVLAAGVLVAWRGPRWPGLSSRYERPAALAAGQRPAADAAGMWESLTRGIDPTDPAPSPAPGPGRPAGE
jgi:uncharacterized membrane protein (TIGR02234 family)